MENKYFKTYFLEAKSIYVLRRTIISSDNNEFCCSAVLQGPITLVSVFVSFQSLFVLLLATFLSSKFPRLIKEAIDMKTIGMKLAAIGLMAFGLYLLSL